MTAIVTGQKGSQYLVDFGDGTGSIYDADEDWLCEPRNVNILAKQPYWNDPPADLPAALVQLLKDLNTPSPGKVSP